jgi:hypothetical protein
MRNAETVVGVHRERYGACETVAGEPVAGTTGTAGSGRGPLEKDLHYRHLASGLPVRTLLGDEHDHRDGTWRSSGQ